LYLLSKQSDSDQTAELEISNSLKRRISKNKLRLARFGAGNDVVCILAEGNSNATNTSMVPIKKLRKLASVEDTFDIIHRYHNIQNNHSCAKTTYNQTTAAVLLWKQTI